MPVATWPAPSGCSTHWGDRQSDEGEAIRHQLCGTPLEAHWYCASCDRIVDQGAETEIRLV